MIGLEKKAFEMAWSRFKKASRLSSDAEWRIRGDFSLYRDEFRYSLKRSQPDWSPYFKIELRTQDTFWTGITLSENLTCVVDFAFHFTSEAVLDLTTTIKSKTHKGTTTHSTVKRRLKLTKGGEVLYVGRKLVEFLSSHIIKLVKGQLAKVKDVPGGDSSRIVPFLEKNTVGLSLVQEDLTRGQWWFEPYNRQREDHFRGYWEEDYASPLVQSVSEKLDKEFGGGLFSVFMDEKGFVGVEATPEGKKHFGF